VTAPAHLVRVRLLSDRKARAVTIRGFGRWFL